MPFDPKQFYRKMESLLAEIDTTEDTDQLLETVMLKLVQTFGEELLIYNGRLYVGEEDGFVLIKTITENEDDLIGLKIPLTYPPMQLLLQNRTYIFDQTTPGLDSQLEERLGGVFSVAILVVGPGDPYILAFGLREGWDREILEFSLNTIRNLINHRFVEVRFQSKLMEAKEIQQSFLNKSNIFVSIGEVFKIPICRISHFNHLAFHLVYRIFCPYLACFQEFFPVSLFNVKVFLNL